MKKETRFGAHIGTSSLLLIFLTLSLVSFGALSLAGANADLRLSEKLLDHTTEYYAANHEAEKFVAATDYRLRQAYAESADADDFYAHMGGGGAQTAVAMNDTQRLVVTVEFVYPGETEASAKTDDGASAAAPASGTDIASSSTPKLYRITEWRIESSDEGSYERHLPVSGSGGVAE